MEAALQTATGLQLIPHAAMRTVPTKYTPTPDPRDIIQAFLRHYADNTRRSYIYDLQDFGRWLGDMSANEAASWFVSRSQPEVNQTVVDYMGHLRDQGRSSGTLLRRRACLATMLKMARALGLTQTSIEVPGPRAESYVDTAGPSQEQLAQIWNELDARAAQHNRRSVRDRAILRLLYNCALRREEVVGLDVAHYDRARCRVSILGKGKTVRRWISLSRQVIAALEAWLRVRTQRPGPLFNRVRASRGPIETQSRLRGESVSRMVQSYGTRAHALRHSAITTALDKTGGDVRAVMRFSRHTNLQTLMIYDDNRRDQDGQVSALLDTSGSPPTPEPEPEPTPKPAPPAELTPADWKNLTPQMARRLLAFLGGKSRQEIANKEGVTLGSVQKSLQHAQQRIPGLRDTFALSEPGRQRKWIDLPPEQDADVAPPPPGIAVKDWKKLTPAQARRLRAFASGLSAPEIAKQEGASLRRVQESLQGAKLRAPKLRRIFEKRLPAHIARRLELFKSGLSRTQIAEREGVTRACVGKSLVLAQRRIPALRRWFAKKRKGADYGQSMT